MFWYFLLFVIGYILIKFFISLKQDEVDLEFQTLDQKFKILIDALNDAVFDNQGKIIRIDTRSVNLFQDGRNQIILFRYSTGHLSVIWKFMLFQKEFSHERQFTNVRNISSLEQQNIANHIIKEMIFTMEKDKIDILKDAF